MKLHYRLILIVIVISLAPAVYYSYLLRKAFKNVMPGEGTQAHWSSKSVYVDFSGLLEKEKQQIKRGDKEIDAGKHIILAEVLDVYHDEWGSFYAHMRVSGLKLRPRIFYYKDKVLNPNMPFLFHSQKYKIQGKFIDPLPISLKFQDPYQLKVRLLLKAVRQDTTIQRDVFSLDAQGKMINKIIDVGATTIRIPKLIIGDSMPIALKHDRSVNDIEVIAFLRVNLEHDIKNNEMHFVYKDVDVMGDNKQLEGRIFSGKDIDISIENKLYEAKVLKVESFEKLSTR